MYRRFLKFVLVQVIGCYLIQTIYAQNPSSKAQYILNQFSTENGLSQGNIYQVFKDSDGFVWIVSEDGLNRFDGYTFSVFKHNAEDTTSISDNIVWCVAEDSDGVLWAGTNQGGLCKYNKNLGNFTRFVHDDDDPKTISQNTVEVIFEASDGRLWVGTHWGLNVFDRSTEQFQSIFTDSDNDHSLLDNRIYSIIETTEKEIWVGTSDGISVFSINGEFTRNISPATHEGIPSGKVTNMLLDDKGDIWASVDGAGLLRFNGKTKAIKGYTSNPNDPKTLGNHYVRSLLVDWEGRLWIGMDGYGFQIWDRSMDTFTRALQNSNFEPDQTEKVYEIYEDDQHNLWFGSYGHGVFVLNNNSNNFTHFSRSYSAENLLSNNSVLAVSQGDDGRVWLGTDGGGINIFDPEDETFEFLIHDSNDKYSLAGNVVKSLLFDKNGNLWAGTYNHGLNVLWKGKNGFEHFTTDNSGLTNESVWALTESRSGAVWIGTLGGGVNKYDPNTKQIEKFIIDFDQDSTLSGVNISTMMEDADGNIWIGSVGHGLNVLDPNTGACIRFSSSMKDSTQLSHNEIRDLFQSSQGDIWVGTTHGLNRYNEADQTFTKFYESDGLPSNVIKGIVEDNEGMFWVSTNNGVSKFDPATKSMTNFNRSDGLQGKEFNYNASIRAKDGTIYMGGINGFNRFNPQLVKSNDHQPAILLTKFLLFNRPVEIGTKGPLPQEVNQATHLEFEYDEYIFTIEYAADEYLFPKRNQYQYKLAGFEPDWNLVRTARLATYTNLPAGDYTFMVRATNNAGVWSDKVRELGIRVNPPWWQTRFAYTIFIVFAALVVITIVRLRTSYLLAQKLRLRRLVSKRTKELEEKNERISMQAEELNTFNDSLNEVNENLEKTVTARTNELVIKNKKLSDYAFLNAHNLRAPVANIKGLVQLFDFELTMEEKEDIIQKLKKQVEDVDAVLFDINQRLREDSLVDPNEIDQLLDQSTNSSSSSS